MKIRSFAVSLPASVMLSASLISCAIPPASPTITPPATQTPTLVIPSQTPAPTATPQSLLPQEVKEKFDQAGIDLKDMTNAEIKPGGMHITLESGEVVLLTNEELEKNIYLGQDNVLQYRDDANQNVIYAFDKETGKWRVGISEAESAAIALFDKYGVDPNTYTLAEVDGAMVGTDNETGKEIFRDGRFEINFASKLAKKDCEPTNFKPDNARYGQIKIEDDSSLRYVESLLNTYYGSPYGTPEPSGWLQDVLIDEKKLCWGFTSGHSLIYRTIGEEEGPLTKVIPIIKPPSDKNGWYIINK